MKFYVSSASASIRFTTTAKDELSAASKAFRFWTRMDSLEPNRNVDLNSPVRVSEHGFEHAICDTIFKGQDVIDRVLQEIRDERDD